MQHLVLVPDLHQLSEVVFVFCWFGLKNPWFWRWFRRNYILRRSILRAIICAILFSIIFSIISLHTHAQTRIQTYINTYTSNYKRMQSRSCSRLLRNHTSLYTGDCALLIGLIAFVGLYQRQHSKIAGTNWKLYAKIKLYVLICARFHLHNIFRYL